MHSHYRDLFQFKGSILSSVFVPTMLTGVWAALWIILMRVVNFNSFAIPGTLITLLNVVLGLLLVFRNNTAYDRYWEGRRLWSTMQKDVRSLSRLIWAHCKAPTKSETVLKKAIMQLIYAFTLSVKHSLRNCQGFEPADLQAAVSHIPGILATSDFDSTPVHAPSKILLYISAYVGNCRETDKCDAMVQTNCLGAINSLTDVVSSLERIRSSPIPKAYSVHMKQILLLYLLALPFQLAKDLIWATIPVVMFTTFALLGIEFISAEIENPFGQDANDLPVTLFCESMRTELVHMMTQPDILNPSKWVMDMGTPIKGSPKVHRRAGDNLVVDIPECEEDEETKREAGEVVISVPL
ncbi:hypothetical protein HK098_003225 [Nowakowskiella sp. JEL0407]|nr:hypothetical protein HK098_003225 [Nowakowskiella sp. JEL0407]